MNFKKREFCIGIVSIIIVLGAVLFICGLKIQNGNKNQRNTDTNYSYAIYLLKNVKIKDVSEISINSVKLEDIPYISNLDIISYNWSEHSFELRKNMIESISNRLVEGLPFHI